MSKRTAECDAVFYMRRALELAALGEGLVEPNPMVGCVITAARSLASKPRIHPSPSKESLESAIIGEGYHAIFGGPHAERAAIADARQRGNETLLSGSTAYVTLEPCCHHGKTPPCTDALIEVGVGRVIVAMQDPFAAVAGQGISTLQSHGVDVKVDVEHTAAAQDLNAPYLKRLGRKRPWVIAKWAMSLDGRIATRTGHSQWISGDESRQRVQVLRSRVDAIVVGIGTALADDPMLNARTLNKPPRKALRVVVDSKLRLPLDSQLVRTSDRFPTLVWCGPDAAQKSADALKDAGCTVVQCIETAPEKRLAKLLDHLTAEYQATNIMVEGGGKLLGSLLELGEIDQCDVFIAPKLIGGEHAISPLGGVGFTTVDDGPKPRVLFTDQVGDDIHLRCRYDWPEN